MNQQKIKKNVLPVMILAMAGVLLSLISIASKEHLLFDECFTINLVRHSVPEIIQLTAVDVHPPLYYLVVRLFVVLFGEGVPAFYGPSILCFMLLLGVSAWFFRKYFSEGTALLIIAVLCAAPNMLKYALQVRMYSMAMLFVTVSFYIVYILAKQVLEEQNYRWNKCWLILAIINVLAAYTHYFAGLAAVAVSFVLLTYLLYVGKERRKVIVNWLIYCGVMIVLYLPWLPTLFRQLTEVHSDYWISQVTEEALHSYPAMLFAMPEDELRILLTAIYILGLFLFLADWKKSHQNFWLAGCYATVGIWFVIGMGYSIIRTPIMVDRYMVPLLPLLWIPVIVTFGKATNKYSKIIVTFVLILCFIQNYEDLYEEYQSDFQNEAVAYLKNSVVAEDVMFHVYVQEMAQGTVYFPEIEHYIYEGMDQNEVFHYWPELTGCNMIKNPKDLTEVNGNIWCMNGQFLQPFEEAGWQVETISLRDGDVYRIFK